MSGESSPINNVWEHSLILRRTTVSVYLQQFLHHSPAIIKATYHINNGDHHHLYDEAYYYMIARSRSTLLPTYKFNKVYTYILRLNPTTTATVVTAVVVVEREHKAEGQMVGNLIFENISNLIFEYITTNYSVENVLSEEERAE